MNKEEIKAGFIDPLKTIVQFAVKSSANEIDNEIIQTLKEELEAIDLSKEVTEEELEAAVLKVAETITHLTPTTVDDKVVAGVSIIASFLSGQGGFKSFIQLLKLKHAK